MSKIPEGFLLQMQQNILSYMRTSNLIPNYWLDETCANEAAKRTAIAYVAKDFEQIHDFLSTTSKIASKITDLHDRAEVLQTIKKATESATTFFNTNGFNENVKTNTFMVAIIDATIARYQVERQMYYEMNRPEKRLIRNFRPTIHPR